MLLVAAFLLGVATVPLAGGRLIALADARVARPWTLGVALAIQIVIISVWPQGDATLHSAAHLVSYAFVLWFLVSNRRMPGLWLVGIGTAMNLAAIAANGGVMPATRPALEAAGLLAGEPHFANSTVVTDPNLAWLGDVFAWPAPLPLANVFSAGDVCLVIGAALIVHQICGSRLAPSSSRRSDKDPVGVEGRDLAAS